MVLDQFKIKYPPTPNYWRYPSCICCPSLTDPLTKGLFSRTAAMGEEERRNRSWLWCPHSTVHKWSFHEDGADKDRRKDKKHSWLRNGIAAPPLCLIQLLRMAFLRLCLVWVMSLSFSPSPPPCPQAPYDRQDAAARASGDFPAVYPGEIKYHVMLENSPAFSSRGLGYLMARIKGPRPEHLRLLLRLVA